MSICTCGARGEVFTSLIAFDQHQVTDYSRRLPSGAGRLPTPGWCGAETGRWHVPVSEDAASVLHC